MLNVSCADGCLVRFGAVYENLNAGTIRALHACSKILTENNRHINVVLQEQRVNCVSVIQVSHNDKVPVPGNMLPDILRYLIFRFIQQGHTGILYFRSNGKTKQGNQDHRHDQQDEHGTPIPENMVKLFLYKR